MCIGTKTNKAKYAQPFISQKTEILSKHKCALN